MLEAGLFARALVRVAAGCPRAGLPRCSRHLATTRDITELNQELDTFFGSAANPESNTKRQLPHSGQLLDAAASTLNNLNRPGMGGISFAADGYQRHQAGHLEQHDVCVDSRPAGYQAQQQQQQEQQHQHTGAQLTHIDSAGSASMVDVSQKSVTVREAQASCVVQLGAAFEPMAANALKKGDVVPVATLAGIQGAKATATLIPLCHNIPLSKVDVKLQLEPSTLSVTVRALARSDGKTGVEMEALTAVSVAALTVYDMCKAVAKDMVIGAVQLDYKAGGKSGLYLRSGLTLQDLLPSARPPV